MDGDYRFACTLCGDCCTGRQTIRLNGEDLELMASFLEISVPDLWASSWVSLDQEGNGLYRPVIAFRTVKVGSRRLRFCPFLENSLGDEGLLRGLCRLHPRFKPLVCTLSPWSREVDLADGSETWAFVPPVEGCPGAGRGDPLTLADIRQKHGPRLDREKEWFHDWESFQKEGGEAWKVNLLSGKAPAILSPRRKP